MKRILPLIALIVVSTFASAQVKVGTKASGEPYKGIALEVSTEKGEGETVQWYGFRLPVVVLSNDTDWQLGASTADQVTEEQGLGTLVYNSGKADDPNAPVVGVYLWDKVSELAPYAWRKIDNVGTIKKNPTDGERTDIKLECPSEVSSTSSPMGNFSISLEKGIDGIYSYSDVISSLQVDGVYVSIPLGRFRVSGGYTCSMDPNVICGEYSFESIEIPIPGSAPKKSSFPFVVKYVNGKSETCEVKVRPEGEIIDSIVFAQKIFKTYPGHNKFNETPGVHTPVIVYPLGAIPPADQGFNLGEPVMHYPFFRYDGTKPYFFAVGETEGDKQRAQPGDYPIEYHSSASNARAIIRVVEYEAVRNISVNEPKTMYVGDIVELNPIVDPINAFYQGFSISIEGESRNLILGKGTALEAISTGDAELSLISEDKGEYGDQPPIKGSMHSVKVLPNDKPLTAISVNPTSLTIPIGRKSTISVSFEPIGATSKGLVWTSEKPSIATITPNANEGQAVLDAVALGKTNIKIVSINRKYEVNVSVEVVREPINLESLTLKTDLPENPVIYNGDVFTVYAVYFPENTTNTDINWEAYLGDVKDDDGSIVKLEPSYDKRSVKVTVVGASVLDIQNIRIVANSTQDDPIVAPAEFKFDAKTCDNKVNSIDINIRKDDKEHIMYQYDVVPINYILTSEDNDNPPCNETIIWTTTEDHKPSDRVAIIEDAPSGGKQLRILGAGVFSIKVRSVNSGVEKSMIIKAIEVQEEEKLLEISFEKDIYNIYIPSPDSENPDESLSIVDVQTLYNPETTLGKGLSFFIESGDDIIEVVDVDQQTGKFKVKGLKKGVAKLRVTPNNNGAFPVTLDFYVEYLVDAVKIISTPANVCLAGQEAILSLEFTPVDAVAPVTWVYDTETDIVTFELINDGTQLKYTVNKSGTTNVEVQISYDLNRKDDFALNVNLAAENIDVYLNGSETAAENVDSIYYTKLGVVEGDDITTEIKAVLSNADILNDATVNMSFEVKDENGDFVAHDDLAEENKFIEYQKVDGINGVKITNILRGSKKGALRLKMESVADSECNVPEGDVPAKSVRYIYVEINITSESIEIQGKNPDSPTDALPIIIKAEADDIRTFTAVIADVDKIRNPNIKWELKDPLDPEGVSLGDDAFAAGFFLDTQDITNGQCKVSFSALDEEIQAKVGSKVTLYAYAEDSAHKDEITGEVTYTVLDKVDLVVVYANVQSIEVYDGSDNLIEDSYTINKSDAFTLRAVVYPINANPNVKWINTYVSPGEGFSPEGLLKANTPETGAQIEYQPICNGVMGEVNGSKIGVVSVGNDVDGNPVEHDFKLTVDVPTSVVVTRTGDPIISNIDDKITLKATMDALACYQLTVDGTRKVAWSIPDEEDGVVEYEFAKESVSDPDSGETTEITKLDEIIVSAACSGVAHIKATPNFNKYKVVGTETEEQLTIPAAESVVTVSLPSFIVAKSGPHRIDNVRGGTYNLKTDGFSISPACASVIFSLEDPEDSKYVSIDESTGVVTAICHKQAQNGEIKISAVLASDASFTSATITLVVFQQIDIKLVNANDPAFADGYTEEAFIKAIDISVLPTLQYKTDIEKITPVMAYITPNCGAVIDPELGGGLLWSLEQGEMYADINSTTGEITVKSPGLITIKASSILDPTVFKTVTLNILVDPKEIVFYEFDKDAGIEGKVEFISFLSADEVVYLRPVVYPKFADQKSVSFDMIGGDQQVVKVDSELEGGIHKGLYKITSLNKGGVQEFESKSGALSKKISISVVQGDYGASPVDNSGYVILWNDIDGYNVELKPRPAIKGPGAWAGTGWDMNDQSHFQWGNLYAFSANSYDDLTGDWGVNIRGKAGQYIDGLPEVADPDTYGDIWNIKYDPCADYFKGGWRLPTAQEMLIIVKNIYDDGSVTLDQQVLGDKVALDAAGKSVTSDLTKEAVGGFSGYPYYMGLKGYREPVNGAMVGRASADGVGAYWTSTSKDKNDNYVLMFNKDGASVKSVGYNQGSSIRCVISRPPVSIKVIVDQTNNAPDNSKNTVLFAKNEKVYLKAEVGPAGKVGPGVIWSSIDENVATVDPIKGIVSAVNTGKVWIYANTMATPSIKDSIQISVTLFEKVPNVPFVIADRNLGASKVTESFDDVASFGHLYQFGRVTPLEKQKSSADKFISRENYIKDVIVPGYNVGNINSGNWDAAKDPCRTELGDLWRLPTSAEWTAIVNANLPEGSLTYLVMAQAPLRMPTSGNRSGDVGFPGRYNDINTYYWSSTRSSNDAYGDVLFWHKSVGAKVAIAKVGTGAAVRCVYQVSEDLVDFVVGPTPITINKISAPVTVKGMVYPSTAAADLIWYAKRGDIKDAEGDDYIAILPTSAIGAELKITAKINGTTKVYAEALAKPGVTKEIDVNVELYPTRILKVSCGLASVDVPEGQDQVRLSLGGLDTYDLSGEVGYEETIFTDDRLKWAVEDGQDLDIAEVSADGKTLTAKKLGEITLIASTLNLDENKDPKTVKVIIKIVPPATSLTFDPLGDIELTSSSGEGSFASLTAQFGFDPSGTVPAEDFTASQEGIVTYDKDSKQVLAQGYGEVYLTPIADGVILKDNIVDRTKKVTVRFPNEVTISIAGGESDIIDDISQNRQLIAKVTDEIGGEMLGAKVTWSVNNDRLADISEEGLLTPKSNGKVIVTATTKATRKLDGEHVTVKATIQIAIGTAVSYTYFDASFDGTDYNKGSDLNNPNVYLEFQSSESEEFYYIIGENDGGMVGPLSWELSGPTSAFTLQEVEGGALGKIAKLKLNCNGEGKIKVKYQTIDASEEVFDELHIIVRKVVAINVEEVTKGSDKYAAILHSTKAGAAASSAVLKYTSDPACATEGENAKNIVWLDNSYTHIEFTNFATGAITAKTEGEESNVTISYTYPDSKAIDKAEATTKVAVSVIKGRRIDNYPVQQADRAFGALAVASEPNVYTQAEAVNLCASLGDSWRLPKQTDFQILIFNIYGVGDTTLDKTTDFATAPYNMFTGTYWTQNVSSGNAKALTISSGGTSIADKSVIEKAFVQCVRDVPVQSVTITETPSGGASYVVNKLNNVYKFTAVVHEALAQDKDEMPQAVKWTSADPSKIEIVNINTGEFKALDKTDTDVVLTATSVADNTKSATIKVKVQLPESIEISGDNVINGAAGTKIELTAKVLPADAVQDVTWTASDADGKVITFIPKAGNRNIVELTSVCKGTVKITATSVADPSVSEEYTVSVKLPVTKVEMFHANLLEAPIGATETITEDKEYALISKVTYGSSSCTDSDVVWAIDAENSESGVLSLDAAKGTIKPLKAGYATINAVSKDDVTKKASVKFTVDIVPTGIVIKYKTIELSQLELASHSEVFELTAEVTPSMALQTDITWGIKSGAPTNIIKVDARGVVTVVPNAESGETTIIVTAKSAAGTAITKELPVRLSIAHTVPGIDFVVADKDLGAPTKNDPGKLYQFGIPTALPDGVIDNYPGKYPGLTTNADWVGATLGGDWSAENPCPKGWFIPTKAQMEQMIRDASTMTTLGLTFSGNYRDQNGNLTTHPKGVGNGYWTSTSVSGTEAFISIRMGENPDAVNIFSINKRAAYPVRCITIYQHESLKVIHKNDPDSSINLNDTYYSEIAVSASVTIPLDVQALPSYAGKAVTWESSDNKIATVDANGVVTPLATGKVSITAISKITPTVKSKPVVMTFVFYKEFSGYKVVDVNVGTSKRLSNSAVPSDSYGNLYQFSRTQSVEELGTPRTNAGSVTGWGSEPYLGLSLNLWSSASDPCVSSFGGGWRLPTAVQMSEIVKAVLSASAVDNTKEVLTVGELGAAINTLASSMEMPTSEFRRYDNGTLSANSSLLYWTSTGQSANSTASAFVASGASMSIDDTSLQANTFAVKSVRVNNAGSVRCITNATPPTKIEIKDVPRLIKLGENDPFEIETVEPVGASKSVYWTSSDESAIKVDRYTGAVNVVCNSKTGTPVQIKAESTANAAVKDAINVEVVLPALSVDVEGGKEVTLSNKVTKVISAKVNYGCNPDNNYQSYAITWSICDENGVDKALTASSGVIEDNVVKLIVATGQITAKCNGVTYIKAKPNHGPDDKAAIIKVNVGLPPSTVVLENNNAANNKLFTSTVTDDKTEELGKVIKLRPVLTYSGGCPNDYLANVEVSDVDNKDAVTISAPDAQGYVYVKATGAKATVSSLIIKAKAINSTTAPEGGYTISVNLPTDVTITGDPVIVSSNPVDFTAQVLPLVDLGSGANNKEVVWTTYTNGIVDTGANAYISVDTTTDPLKATVTPTCFIPDGTTVSLRATSKATPTKYKEVNLSIDNLTATSVEISGDRVIDKVAIIQNMSETINLMATVVYQMACSSTSPDKVTWKSSNPGIATVSADGKLTPISAGTVTITATVKGAVNSAVKDNIEVKISPEPYGIRLKEGSTVYPDGYIKRVPKAYGADTDIKLDAFVIYSETDISELDKRIVWSSDDTNIATVDVTGKVTVKAGAYGQVKITATSDTGNSKVVTSNFILQIGLFSQGPDAGFTLDKYSFSKKSNTSITGSDAIISIPYKGAFVGIDYKTNYVSVDNANIVVETDGASGVDCSALNAANKPFISLHSSNIAVPVSGLGDMIFLIGTEGKTPILGCKYVYTLSVNGAKTPVKLELTGSIFSAPTDAKTVRYVEMKSYAVGDKVSIDIPYTGASSSSGYTDNSFSKVELDGSTKGKVICTVVAGTTTATGSGNIKVEFEFKEAVNFDANATIMYRITSGTMKHEITVKASQLIALVSPDVEKLVEADVNLATGEAIILDVLYKKAAGTDITTIDANFFSYVHSTNNAVNISVNPRPTVSGDDVTVRFSISGKMPSVCVDHIIDITHAGTDLKVKLRGKIKPTNMSFAPSNADAVAGQGHTISQVGQVIKLNPTFVFPAACTDPDEKATVKLSSVTISGTNPTYFDVTTAVGDVTLKCANITQYSGSNYDATLQGRYKYANAFTALETESNIGTTSTVQYKPALALALGATKVDIVDFNETPIVLTPSINLAKAGATACLKDPYAEATFAPLVSIVEVGSADAFTYDPANKRLTHKCISKPIDAVYKFSLTGRNDIASVELPVHLKLQPQSVTVARKDLTSVWTINNHSQKIELAANIEFGKTAGACNKLVTKSNFTTELSAVSAVRWSIDNNTDFNIADIGVEKAVTTAAGCSSDLALKTGNVKAEVTHAGATVSSANRTVELRLQPESITLSSAASLVPSDSEVADVYAEIPSNLEYYRLRANKASWILKADVDFGTHPVTSQACKSTENTSVTWDWQDKQSKALLTMTQSNGTVTIVANNDERDGSSNIIDNNSPNKGITRLDLVLQGMLAGKSVDVNIRYEMAPRGARIHNTSGDTQKYSEIPQLKMGQVVDFNSTIYYDAEVHDGVQTNPPTNPVLDNPDSWNYTHESFDQTQVKMKHIDEAK